MKVDADFAAAMDGVRPRGEALDRARVLSAVLARHGTGSERTVRVGRYALERRLGRGGQGVVWAARDPTLARRVAVKVLTQSDGSDAHDRERLWREAQSLARVEHPNIAQVYDVGFSGDGVFVVMELVDGVDLGRWLATERDARAVVDVFARAGRGLAAVHAQQLVHHDFKPANVMVGNDGAVKVVDFGLARLLDPLATDVDRPGGTLHYMAPEQRRGAVGDAASDQFAFCVSLRDALGDRASPSVGAALRRGLQPRPQDRWPAMEALLEALMRAAPRNRAMWWGAAAAAGVAASFVAAASPAAHTGCEIPPSSWSPQTRATVVGNLAASELETAAGQRGLASIDAFAQAWTEARASTCAQPPGNADAQASGRCLGRLEARLRTLVQGMGGGDATTYAAWRAAVELPSPSVCTTGLQRLPEPATSPDRTAAAQIRERLAASQALVDSARASEASVEIAQLRRDASVLGFAPLEAEVAFLAGWAAVQTRDLDVAVAHLEDAVHLASGSDHDRIVAQASIKLAYVVGKLQARPVQGLHWAEHAEVAVARVGSPAALEGELASARGRTRLSHGDLEQAVEDLHRAVDLQRAAYGPEDLRLAAATTALGMALQGRGRYAEALEAHGRSVALFEGDGKRHPDLPVALAGLASTRMLMDDLDAAGEGFVKAVEASEAIHGRDDPFASPLFANLATIHWRQGRIEDAQVGYRRALAIETAKASPHPQVLASIHVNLAALSGNLGDYETAVEHYGAALALFDEQGGACTPNYAATLLGLGGALDQLERTDEAWSQVEAGVDCARQLGADHPYLAQGLLALGEFELGSGAPRKAIALAEEALAISERNPAVAGAENRAQFLLASARWEAGEDRRGAVALVRTVARAYAAEPPVRPGEEEQVRAWLQARG